VPGEGRSFGISAFDHRFDVASKLLNHFGWEAILVFLDQKLLNIHPLIFDLSVRIDLGSASAKLGDDMKSGFARIAILSQSDLFPTDRDQFPTKQPVHNPNNQKISEIRHSAQRSA
jgi:hypothetical protein